MQYITESTGDMYIITDNYTSSGSFQGWTTAVSRLSTLPDVRQRLGVRMFIYTEEGAGSIIFSTAP